MIDYNFIRWDQSNWERALKFLENNKAKNFRNKKVLELGGRDASLSLWAASQGGSVICSDIVNIDKNIMKKICDAKIDFKIIDALDIPYDDYFDFIIFKSLLGGIGRGGAKEKQLLVMRQIKKSLKKDGECLFIENMAGTILHQIFRNRYGAGKNDWHYPSLKEFYKMSNIFKDVKFNTYGFFGSTRKMKKDLRAKFDYNYDKYLPENWRYVYAGIYRK